MTQLNNKVRTLVIIDDKSLNFKVDGYDRGKIYKSLIYHLMNYSHSEIAPDKLKIFQIEGISKKNFEDSEDINETFNWTILDKNIEVNLLSKKYCFDEIEQDNFEIANFLFDNLSEIAEEVLVLLDAQLVCESAEDIDKEKAVKFSLGLYNSLNNKFKVIYYTMQSGEIKKIIKNNNETLFKEIVDVSWYDVKASAEEIWEAFCEKFNS